MHWWGAFLGSWNVIVVRCEWTPQKTASTRQRLQLYIVEPPGVLGLVASSGIFPDACVTS